MSKYFTILLAVLSLNVIAQQLPARKPAPDLEKLGKHSMKQETLLDKMEKAVDPKNVAKSWKTSVLDIEMSIPMQQIKIQVTGIYKYPDKSKISSSIPGMPTITQVYNGKQAWKETAGLGIQMKTGMELAYAKFSCKKSDPALKPTEVYSKISLDPFLYKVGKYSCYKLLCYPPEELNMPAAQVFVDDKEYLIRYNIESQLTDMGVVPVALTPSDYKDIKGLKTPMLVTMNMMGIKMVGKVLSIKINEKVPDSEFELPEQKQK